METSDAQNLDDLPSQPIPAIRRERFAERLQYRSWRGPRHFRHRECDYRRRRPKQAALRRLAPVESLPKDPGRERARVALRISLWVRRLTLDLCVQFRAGEDNVGGQIEPQQQNDDGAERTV